MKIKVCGITTLEQMQQLQHMDVDYAGMIFYEGSRRFVADRLEGQKAEVSKSAIKKVGVFVNADYNTIVKAVEGYGLSAVQLHGDETDEFCLELMDKVKVIKVFRIGGEGDIDALTEPFLNVCHYFLFDTATKAYGGSGKQFNWAVLEKAKINKRFFLSGGIGLDDTGALKAFQHPYLYAIDVNSRFETEPGVKDMAKVQQFVNALNHE
ncbi:MAG TPA: phosphoribosylanthranilate isomerase [Flavisolibacter sp.]|nr:phosphoribosylanthranilate isomerase [Flavisolibacter sp.]